MSVLELAIGWLAPSICVGCQAEGEALCLACEESELLAFGERCFNCNKLSPDSKTCTACRSKNAPSHVWVVTDYAGPAKELIQKYKFSQQRAAARAIGRVMAKTLLTQKKKIDLSAGDYLLVPVPTASSRIRQRSFDHTQLLARNLSAELSLPWSPALQRLGQKKQVGSPRRLRMKQAEGAYRVKRPEMVKRRRIIIVDDVVTTGATISEIAKLLRQAGARSVDALVFAKKL